MIHFQLIFGMRFYIEVHFLVYECPIPPALFVEKTNILPTNCFCTFVKNLLAKSWSFNRLTQLNPVVVIQHLAPR